MMEPIAIATAARRPHKSAAISSRPPRTSLRLPVLLAAPVTASAALAVHLFISAAEPANENLLYRETMGALLVFGIASILIQPFWAALRNWMRDTAPIIGAAILLVCGWEILTAGIRLLPMPYFPTPGGVIQSLVNDSGVIFDSTWHSLLLLGGGYAAGVFAGLVTGVCIGWFPFARYWGMPILKIVGPIPATAWIPLAMIISPSATISAIGLIALAVWFPVTMLTASGIANTKASYLDVARTLGASRCFLIFRVAIPAAMPSIFIGLFMGLGASFLTLVVAETIGVKSGLGWYVTWAQGWAEYGKVYAALIIMAAFFSTIMTLLFKVRDRVLVWQKGVIKW